MAHQVISDISYEAKALVGELMTLIRALDPKELELFVSGETEVKEMFSELGISEP
jgi:hypothetical protein